MLKENYTTKTRKIKDPVGEADKTEITDDTFATCEIFELLINTMRNK